MSAIARWTFAVVIVLALSAGWVDEDPVGVSDAPYGLDWSIP